MDFLERDKLVNRIICNAIRFQFTSDLGRKEHFLLKSPTTYEKYLGNLLYEELYGEYLLDGLYTDEELLEYMVSEGFWTMQEEQQITSLKKEIENFKLELFQSKFKSLHRQTLRKYIKVAKETLIKLIEKKSTYNHLSAHGCAGMAKIRFLIGKSIYTQKRKKIFGGSKFWKSNSRILEKAVLIYNDNQLEEADYRILSRTEPWRLIWACKKSANHVFSKPSTELTDEQKTLCYWSSVYDSIYESPDCPEDSVIDDDDMLDGFLIEQRNKRGENVNKNEDFTNNPKIKNADEVYLVAETVEDAQKIDKMNTDSSKAVKASRQKAINQKGFVNEVDLPDVKKRLIMEYNKKFHQSFKES